MARAALDWSQQHLANEAGVRQVTVSEFEGGRTDPRRSTVDKLRKALERGGVVFITEGEASIAGGPGVRLKGSA